MRDVYSKYWQDTRIKYGFINYDRSLISELTKIKQDGKVVIDYVRSVMVWKIGHAPNSDIFPQPIED